MLSQPLTILSALAVVLTIATLAGAVIGLEQNLKERIRSWWWIIGVLGSAILLGRTAVIALFAGISFIVLREFLALTQLETSDRRAIVTTLVLVLPFQYALVGIGQANWLTFLVVPVLIAFSGDTRNYLARTAELLSGQWICIYCISCVPALFGRNQQSGPMIFLILVTQASDVLQYTFGKVAGRHKIAPSISPSKTVEGFIGAILSATALGAGLYWLTPFKAPQAGVLAFIIALAGFLGGLVMSAIKRDRGVKDWSQLIPGHGGMLDRVDSLCFSAPLFLFLTRALFSAPPPLAH